MNVAQGYSGYTCGEMIEKSGVKNKE